MERAIFEMFEKYNCVSDDDYKNALKEIVQEVVLLGLWRGKFFEHAAFYGGTALRILYRLDRYSEDLDFSLLTANPNFDLHSYHSAVKNELSSFGFDVEIMKKNKIENDIIQSAFLKGNTKELLLKIGVPNAVQKRCHSNEVIKVKFEIDIDPPGNFRTEVVSMLQPIPFWVRTYVKPDLFSGKLHALLCRQWGNRIKGRDWYDFLWYIKNEITVNLKHLEKRMQQSAHFPSDKSLTIEILKKMINEKIEGLDLELAKKDVRPYIKNKSILDGWTKDAFKTAVDRLEPSIDKDFIGP